MEFNFNFTPLLTHASLPAADAFCDSEQGADSSQPPTILTRWTYGTIEKILRSADKQLVNNVFGTAVDEMGKRSASAQQLKQVITTYSKFSGSNDRIYLHCTLPNICNGLLRVGEKKLFIRDEIGNVKEITPSCVLDFYVHESKQRSGIGKQLFEFMLHSERAAYASKFGYDRPSPKLLAFLKKHYDLSSYVPQNNNFVVFRKYFTKEAHENPPSSSGGASRNASQQSSSHQQQSGARRGNSYDSDAGYGSRTSQYGAAAAGARASNARNNDEYAHYSQPQSSPPAGQASFSRFDDSSPGDARRLQYEDEQKASAAASAYPYEHERGSSNDYESNPAASSNSSFSNTYSGSSYGGRSEGSRLARAGSNMLSTSNLMQTQQPQRSPSSSATASFQSPFSPVNAASSSTSPAAAPSSSSSSSYSRSTSNNQPQYSPSSQQQKSQQGDPYPFSRMTQYHQHNIITGYASDKGHSNFSNKSQQPANFLPDGITPPQGQSGSDSYSSASGDNRQRYPRSGVQPKPFVDPTPYTMKQVDNRIDKLESAIREKEAALSNVPRFAIPHHTPDERDARWSKAAVYQRQVNGWAEPNAYTDPSNPQATGVTEKHAQYSNPAHSYKIGGGQNPINHQPVHQSSNPPRSSPFAYGSRR